MSLVTAGVNHRAGAKEQQRFEEGVRDQVEHAGQPAADAQGQHHVAQLADGRVGQHALDVGGGDGDRGGQKQRDAADVGDHQQHFGREHRIEPPHQVDAGGHHRRRVDQGRDGRGAFHRIGQPDVQRELGALADAAAEDAQAGDDQQPVAAALRSPVHRHARIGRPSAAVRAWPMPRPTWTMPSRNRDRGMVGLGAS